MADKNAVRLRGHHLLCLLTYKGLGYSPEFVAGMTARVTTVHEDAEGNTHIGVVVGADPAPDLQQWHGRALYFSPEEIEPLGSKS